MLIDEMYLNLYSFLTSAVDRGDWSASRFVRITAWERASFAHLIRRHCVCSGEGKAASAGDRTVVAQCPDT